MRKKKAQQNPTKNNHHNWKVYVHMRKETLKRLMNGQAKTFSHGYKTAIS